LNGAVTKANVISELEKVLNVIPIEIRGKSDLNICVSNDIANFYMQAQVAGGNTYGHGGDVFDLKYGAYTLTPLNGLPANTFVVSQAKNLAFGTGLMNDFQELRIKDMDESDLSGTVRYKMVYTAGTQYYNGSEIVWYLTTT
jgi:hypothetical protein